MPGPIDLHVGHRIRAMRIERELTQDAVASHLRVSPQQLSRYEKGMDRVGPGRLFELASLFAVPIGSFFAGIDGDHPSEGRPLPDDVSRTMQRQELLDTLDALETAEQREALLRFARKLVAQHRPRAGNS